MVVLSLSLLSLVPPEAGAQDSPPEARVMSENESEALRQWARRRLDELESGAAEGISTLPHSLDTERLWALYFLYVEEKDWEKTALALADSLAERQLPEALHVQALAGALEVVRAKHSRWPPNKLKYLRTGISMLDHLTSQAPEDPVVRYLRAVSGYYLPFFLERNETVEEDFEVLARTLPGRGDVFSPAVYRAVLQFVLEHGDPGDQDREALENALKSQSGASGEGTREPPAEKSEAPLGVVPPPEPSGVRDLEGFRRAP
jgi:hypothetical protein